MGMTNRQWQGWLRTIIELLKSRLEVNQNQDTKKELENLLELFQSMLEDGTD